MLSKHREPLVGNWQHTSDEDGNNRRPIMPNTVILIIIQTAGPSRSKRVQCEKPVVHDKLLLVEGRYTPYLSMPRQ